MSKLKSNDGSTRLSVSEIYRDAILEVITQNIDFEVNYNDVQATLPKLLSSSDSVIKVHNDITDDFIVCSIEGLISLIQEALNKQQTTPSFFDDMESFETKEKIGIEVLDNLPLRAPEYSKEEAGALSNLSER